MIENGYIPDITLPSLADPESEDDFQPVDSVQPPKPHAKPIKAKQLKAAERLQRVIDLRIQGWSQEAIAQDIGVSRQMVAKLVAQACAIANEAQADRVDQYRRLQEVRLDAAIKGIWSRIQQGDILAVAQLVKIEERRAKLLGLDAPQRVQVGMDLEALPDAQLRSIAMRLGMAVEAPKIPEVNENDVRPSIEYGQVPNCLPVAEVLSSVLGEESSEEEPSEELASELDHATTEERVLDEGQEQGDQDGFASQ